MSQEVKLTVDGTEFVKSPEPQALKPGDQYRADELKGYAKTLQRYGYHVTEPTPGRTDHGAPDKPRQPWDDPLGIRALEDRVGDRLTALERRLNDQDAQCRRRHDVQDKGLFDARVLADAEKAKYEKWWRESDRRLARLEGAAAGGTTDLTQDPPHRAVDGDWLDEFHFVNDEALLDEEHARHACEAMNP